jgi:hypothetical protein
MRGLTDAEEFWLAEAMRPNNPGDGLTIETPADLAVHDALVSRGLVYFERRSYTAPDETGKMWEWKCDWCIVTPLGRIALQCHLAAKGVRV